MIQKKELTKNELVMWVMKHFDLTEQQARLLVDLTKQLEHTREKLQTL